MFHTPRWLYQSGGQLIHRFELDWALSNRNDGRSHHFGRTKRERDDLQTYLKTFGRPTGVAWPCPAPIVLVITRVIQSGGRHWDADSIGRGNAKELIDALVARGYFHDDSPSWIRHVVWNQSSSERPERGRTQVQIWTGDSYSEIQG